MPSKLLSGLRGLFSEDRLHRLVLRPPCLSPLLSGEMKVRQLPPLGRGGGLFATRRRRGVRRVPHDRLALPRRGHAQGQEGIG